MTQTAISKVKALWNGRLATADNIERISEMIGEEVKRFNRMHREKEITPRAFKAARQELAEIAAYLYELGRA